MINLLKNIGLEESETKIYLALLELSSSSVSEITNRAGITRTLGYHMLNKLSWNNLVSRVKTKGKKIIFTAEYPRRVIQFAQN